MESPIKVIADNRKASFDYFLYDRYEAGLVLFGTEIKSIRRHSVNIKDSYVMIKNGEAYVYGMHIAPYEEGNIFNKDPLRNRKLLLHSTEIRKLQKKIKEDGYTLVPTKVYLKKGKAKLEISLAKGKHSYDKRESLKQKSIQKETNELNRHKY